MNDTNSPRFSSEVSSTVAGYGLAQLATGTGDNLIAANDPNLGTNPAAEIFPLLDGKAFDELVADIKAHGLREPITLDPDGRVLDGRNRLLACRVAGVTPEFRQWDGGGSAVQYVISMNLHRRHLDTSQRSIIAARISEMRQGERTDLSEISERLSQPEAAKMLKVSPDSVGFGRKVLNDGDPALVQAVDRGDIPVSVAAEVATLMRDEQREVVSGGRRAASEAAKRSRFARAATRHRRPLHRNVGWELTKTEQTVLKEALQEWVSARPNEVYDTDLDVLATKLGISLRW